ncbi:MAG: hypothetical protein FWF96_07195, partial [Kiritimatiellaeota bacterium]|nr:hypothetical protein [Kiritimatiellota bacterium]
MALHIHSGDIAANLLASAGCGDPQTVWSDVLHVGALDWRWPDELRHRVRAHALHDRDNAPWTLDGIEKHLREQDGRVDAAPQHDAVILWMDVCLYDQLILCFLLDRLYGLPNLWLVCLGEVPGGPRFHGYGELAPAQMLSLLPLRQPVTAGQFAAARLAWRNVADPKRSPERLRALAPQTAALPFLPAALERMADELCDANGLTRTDRNILALRGTVSSRAELFRAAQALEPAPFMGD